MLWFLSLKGRLFMTFPFFSGIKTAFVKQHSDTAFIAAHCEMIPIEWVCRRVATGSFLKRNPGVKEGYRFQPLKMEMFFKVSLRPRLVFLHVFFPITWFKVVKSHHLCVTSCFLMQDDANNDPQWSEEQLLEAKFSLAGLTIGQCEVDIMNRSTVAIFEILEKAWATLDCTLVDMKVCSAMLPSAGETGILVWPLNSCSWFTIYPSWFIDWVWRQREDSRDRPGWCDRQWFMAAVAIWRSKPAER